MAAAVASLTAATLSNQGIDGGEALVALVFLVIGATVIVSGLLGRPLAAALGVRLPQRDRVAILGARGLAIGLADQLRAADTQVVFMEADPKRSRLAEEAGYPVVFGDPLDERTMLRARPELVGKAIGLTFNEHFNSLFVRQALERFDIPHGLVALESLFGEQTSSLIPEDRADVLFDGPHDHERWDARWRHGEVSVHSCVYWGGARLGPLGRRVRPSVVRLRSQELFVFLSVTRDRGVTPMRMNYTFRKGDVAAIAVFTPQLESAMAELDARGWTPAQEESEGEGEGVTEVDQLGT